MFAGVPRFLSSGRLPAFAVLLALFAAASVSPRLAAAQTGDQANDQEARTHYSLYYENFKNGDYAAALPDLRWMLENAPGFPRGNDTNYERAVETYEGLAEKASDEATKKAYLDSALTMVDQAPAALKEASIEVDEYKWTLKKGRLIQNNYEALPEQHDAMLAAYKKAWEMKPGELNKYYIDRIIRSYLPDDKEGAVAFMDEVEAERGGNAEIDELLSTFRNRVFTSPEERIGYLEGELEKSPDDVELISQLFDLYMQTNQRDEASRLGERLAEADPTPETLRILGQMHLEDNESQEAFDLYQQAVELAGGDATAEDYYNMGIAQQQMGQPSQARTYFRRAIDANPSFGQAYIAIGDLYAGAVSECGGEEMSRDDQAVYWLVTDYYQQAKSADPSVANTANQKISSYRPYYPDQEALFFKNWEVGQPYQVNSGCYSWINETTTVKSP